MSELPTPREELTRKAFETLERLLVDLEKAKISDAQFETGVDVLFSATSGMVSDDFFHTISQVKTSLKSDFTERRIFLNKDCDLLVMERPIGEGKVTIKRGLQVDGTWKRVVVKSFEDAPVPTHAAMQAVQNYIADFTVAGFKEI